MCSLRAGATVSLQEGPTCQHAISAGSVMMKCLSGYRLLTCAVAAAQETRHDGYARRLARLPRERLSHCWQRERVADVSIAKGVVGGHTDVPGVILLRSYPL